MTDHSPTCALLVHHAPCDCHDTPETPTDRAARLALDLGRARRRIAELEAAEGRIRAVAEQHRRIAALQTDPELYVMVPSFTVAEDIDNALDGPPDDQQDRKAPT